MSVIITIIHILACVSLIIIVLLQTGKGASLGAAFGGSSQTVFGSAGAATFLTKITTVVGILFMLTSLGITFFGIGTKASTSVMENVTPPAQVMPLDNENQTTEQKPN